MANTDLMIDLETLDTAPTATVLTIGAVRFDPLGNELDRPTMTTLYLKVDPDSSHDLGCTVSEATIEWWSKQDPQALEEAFEASDRLTVREAMARLHQFAWGCQRVWSHGAGFDVVICEHLFRKTQRAIPWSYWQVRDTRTIYDLGIDPQCPQILKHHAMEDAWAQAVGVQNVVRGLRDAGLTPFS